MNTDLEEYKIEFISSAMYGQALMFGEFKLKSGRISPYYFNSGMFNSGNTLNGLSEAYTSALISSNIAFDTIYGPAYKGIPLCVSTALAFKSKYALDINYAFDRKEVKDHGDGGSIVGVDLKNKNVVIIDDVITSGVSIQEAIRKVQNSGGNVCAIIVALDRQETSIDENESAIRTIEKAYDIPIISIINVDNLISFCSHRHMYKEASSMKEYLDKYKTS